MKIKEQLHNGQYKEAEASWSELEEVVIANSNSIVPSLSLSLLLLQSAMLLLLLLLPVPRQVRSCLCQLCLVQDFYNFLKDDAPATATTAATQRGRSLFSFRSNKGYSGYLSSKASATPGREGGFSGLMNTVIKDKLGIIPKNVSCVLLLTVLNEKASLIQMSSYHVALLSCM